MPLDHASEQPDAADGSANTCLMPRCLPAADLERSRGSCLSCGE
jgi:hypothetical protein